MGSVRSWLMMLIAASTLCALADGLMSSGPVKGVGKVVCAMVLICAVLTPVIQLDPEGRQLWPDDCFCGLEEGRRALKGRVDEEMRAVIEGECAAYIEDKAAQEGIACEAAAECCESEEGLWIPHRVRVTGSLSDGEQSWLSRLIWEELGVPEERQSYTPEGYGP